MATKEIERRRWNEEFNRLSLEHTGAIISLEIIGEEIGAQTEAQRIPFSGISADFKDGENRIAILVGLTSESHTTHTINEPVHVHIKQNDAGDDEALVIEAADCTKTILQFRASSQTHSANMLLTK